MKNNESFNSDQNEQANRWFEVLGDHATNAIGNGRFQTVEEFRKEKAAREASYDPEREAWEKAHPHHEDEAEDLPRTALDYMREDLEELQYGPLESYEDKPVKLEVDEADKETSSEPETAPKNVVHENTPQAPKPQDFYEPEAPQASSESQESSQPKAPESVPHGEKPMEVSDDHKSFESEHLKWPEETLDEKLDRTFAEAEDVLGHAEDALADQRKQRAEQLEADEIAEINRVIAEMAYSGDEKLVEIMRQKDYESDEDHKDRLVRMAKTEMKWRQLKKSIEDARKHMEADNAALERTRASLKKSREVANAPRSEAAPAKPVSEKPAEPAPKVVESSPGTTTSAASEAEPTPAPVVEQSSSTETTEQTPDQKILKRDLADRVRDALRKRGEEPASQQPSSPETTESNPQPSHEEAEPSTKSESESQPEKKILRKDLKDVLRAKIAAREAESGSAEKEEAEPEFDPESLSRARSIFAEYQREMADYNKSEKLDQAKAAVAEHQRRVEHADDKLNAERDKLMKERSPSTRKKISKIFGAFSQRLKDRKEKSRKKAEKLWQEENEPWL